MFAICGGCNQNFNIEAGCPRCEEPGMEIDERKCPECKLTGSFDMERCIDGNTKCNNCGFVGTHKEFYAHLNKNKPVEPALPANITSENGLKVWQDPYDNFKHIREEKDYIVAQGGDGTLLKAIQLYRHAGKPFLGVAGGTVNFLMNKDGSVYGDSKYKKFNLLKVKVTYKKHHSPEMNDFFEKKDDFRTEIVKEEFQAFNEICLGGDMGSWIDFNVHDRDSIIGKFKGSGIIISTSQGTTGINMNNNGVILPLSSKNWSITGDKCNRKINYIISPKRTSITCSSRGNITLWIDGTNKIIKEVQKIEISKGDTVTVIFNDYNEFKKKRRI